jgi:exopolysaccharide biosynthesis WecB/TagA/CpsF family protein
MNSTIEPQFAGAVAPVRRKWNYRQVSMFSDLLPLADLMLVLLSAWAAALLYARWFGQFAMAGGPGNHAAQASLIALVLAPLMLRDRRFLSAASRGGMRRLVGSFALRFLAYAGTVLALGTVSLVLVDVRAAWLLLWFVAALSSTLGVRVLLVGLLERMQRLGHLTEVVAIVGAGPVADRLVFALLQTRPEKVELLGIFDDPVGAPIERKFQTSGTVEDLLELGKTRRIDWIVLTLPSTSQRQMDSLVRRLKALSAPIGLCGQDVGLASMARGDAAAGAVGPARIVDRRAAGSDDIVGAGFAVASQWLRTLAVWPRGAGGAHPSRRQDLTRSAAQGRTARLRFEFDDYDLDGFGPVAAKFGMDRYGYVVTPNADHLIRLSEDGSFRALYASAAYVLLDSRFLAHLLRWARRIRLPVCTGSDLTAKLLGEMVAADDRVVLIGGTDLQAQAIRERYGLRALAHLAPPMGFIRDAEAVERCLQFVEAHSPFRFCLLAVGSPQQEVLARQLQLRGTARGLAVCVGASIDFLTGVERRAPRWVQRAGIEWLFRLAQAPRRLGHRYLVRGPRVFGLLRGAQIVLRPTTSGAGAAAGPVVTAPGPGLSPQLR